MSEDGEDGKNLTSTYHGTARTALEVSMTGRGRKFTVFFVSDLGISVFTVFPPTKTLKTVVLVSKPEKTVKTVKNLPPV
jgi:hypothetical protein